MRFKILTRLFEKQISGIFCKQVVNILIKIQMLNRFSSPPFPPTLLPRLLHLFSAMCFTVQTHVNIVLIVQSTGTPATNRRCTCLILSLSPCSFCGEWGSFLPTPWVGLFMYFWSSRLLFFLYGLFREGALRRCKAVNKNRFCQYSGMIFSYMVTVIC